jgi:hypothetical protein
MKATHCMKKIFSLHCFILFLLISCSVNAQKSPALVNMSLTKPEKAILYTGVDNVLMLKGEVPGKYLQIERSNGPVEWKGGTQLRAIVRYEQPCTDTFRVYAGEKLVIEKVFEVKPLGTLKAGLKGTRDTLLSATELATITGLELTMPETYYRPRNKILGYTISIFRDGKKLRVFKMENIAFTEEVKKYFQSLLPASRILFEYIQVADNNGAPQVLKAFEVRVK